MRKLFIGLMISAFVIVAVAYIAGPAVSGEGKHGYIGAAKCKTCHKTATQGEQFPKWEKSGHAGAFATLASEASMKIAKEKGIEDPQKAAECLSCHVTAHGVDAALIGEKFDMANGVSCEGCHGGGADYYKSATMKGLMKGEIEAASVGLALPDEKTCLTCHNDKSPTFKEFDYEKMVAKIAHPIPDERKAKYKGE